MSESKQNDAAGQAEDQPNSLPVERRTYLRSLAAGAAITGGTAGGAAAEESASASDDSEPTQTGCNGGVGYGCVPYGRGRYGGGPPALPGIDTPPRDLTHTPNGTFEDLDGDQQFDIFDVQSLYAHRNDPIVSDYYAAYDFDNSQDGDIDILDIQGLFDTLT